MFRFAEERLACVLLYGCETWTLNTDLKRWIDVFGNKCLWRIFNCEQETKYSQVTNTEGTLSVSVKSPLLG